MYITETWLQGKIHKKGGIKSIFNNHHICRIDRGTSLVLHQDDGEHIKQ